MYIHILLLMIMAPRISMPPIARSWIPDDGFDDSEISIPDPEIH